MLNHRLKVAEWVFVVASVIGWAVAAASSQIIYGAVPLSIALLLNLINRLRFEQQIKRRLTAALAQLHRQISQENQSFYSQQIQDAIASFQANLPEYLAQLEVPDSQSNILKFAQLQAQINSLEQSLRSVVDYLNSASLPTRVQDLEEAITNATAELARMQRLPSLVTETLDESAGLSTHQLSELATSPSLFPVVFESVPEETPSTIEPIVPTWSEVHIFEGHSDWVSALAMSPDGQILASGSLDKNIKLWNLSTSNNTHTLCGHVEGVLCLAISPDGQILASGGFDQTIKLWRLDSGQLLYTLKGHEGSVRSLAITPDSQTLISASFDQTIKLWRLDSGQFLQNLAQDAGHLSAIALSPDGQILASGGGDGTINLWRLDTQTLELTLTGNLSSICALAISPDSQILPAGCTDGYLKLWQLSTAEPLGNLDCQSGLVIPSIFSIQGQTFIGSSAEETIKIWQLNTGEVLTVLNYDATSSVMSLAMSPNGEWIAGGMEDDTIKVWRQDE
ncbi:MULTISPECIES: WD40 repeat domain-containing protein [unclassified Coleofasciculus]|uniref:WD40 repeat domain-containing protein n=1 Tax=unclassified Coleofasciculus TaxID=2692782 RepID=UPI00187F532A|nr:MULTISPECIES: WD40 repeat domain-containing protein [unclassified Coleofasciculus]MBE9129858.1 WD40 repeat domain-containing protein [Coleofasciculus sp. LEGE 07081]MBE9152310.1 WD40 repeat domain-containing protein [Coleofasciculus sp. LEGE 07092]